MTIEEAEVELRAALDKAIDMGWTPTPSITVINSAKKCCAYGAWLVVNGYAENEDAGIQFAIDAMGLPRSQWTGATATEAEDCGAEELMWGFDGHTPESAGISGNGWFELGKRLRADYWKKESVAE